ncbi:MAG: DUF6798 domain-containing protein [Cyanobacteria bacterium P01_F01_bin.150]
MKGWGKDILAMRGAIAQFLLWGLLFGIGYTQDAIYNSPENQNTKYFHALARAGHGFLSEDWLATTLDPLPAFTALVQFTYTYLHPEYAFYVYYLLIFGLYIYSLRGIADSVFPISHHPLRISIFLALFFFIHIVHIEIFTFDTGWELHAGVAEQYILGPVFQPANFGAFILLSIHLFLRRHPFWSVTMLAIAVTMHPAYFPSIAALIGVYVVLVTWNECKGFNRTILRPFGIGFLGIVLVLPVYLYMTLAFQDTSHELAQQATDIIVNQRIPHHSLPEYWLRGRAYAQAVVVAIAFLLVRKHRLGAILGVPFVLAVGLTALQFQINSDTLAFVAPWRMSVFLVPLSTCLILGKTATSLSGVLPDSNRAQTITKGICIGIIGILVLAGGLEQLRKFQDQDHTIPLLNRVKDTAQSGQVYLIPPEERALRKFRLYTGAAIFTNRKSHPYKDTEVIEWGDRWNLANRFYRSKDKNQCKLLRRQIVKNYGVTHVVMPVGDNIPTLSCKKFTEVYQDDHYKLYEHR